MCIETSVSMPSPAFVMARYQLGTISEMSPCDENAAACCDSITGRPSSIPYGEPCTPWLNGIHSGNPLLLDIVITVGNASGAISHTDSPYVPGTRRETMFATLVTLTVFVAWPESLACTIAATFVLPAFVRMAIGWPAPVP